jgi:MoxR-like ATPase
MDLADASRRSTDVVESISDAVVTRRSFVETVVTGVVAGGHVLLEDVPGTGKTLTARSLATALGLEFSRIQFTPDLLPADVTGSYVFNERDREILDRRAERDSGTPTAWQVLTPEDIRELQAVPERVTVDSDLRVYITRLAQATRQHPQVEVGVSPRGGQRLFELSRARAVVEGRDFATPDDVREVAHPTLAHRLVLTPDARVNDVSRASIIDEVLEEVPVPTVAR